MPSNRWQQISKVYNAALAQAPGAREAFLRDACAGDDALYRAVQSLLSQGQPGDSQSYYTAPGAPRAADAGGGLTGRRLGAYQIQALLGVGGMGEKLCRR